MVFFYGLANIAGGIMTGQLIDRFSIKTAIFVILCVTYLAVAFLITFILSKKWGFLAYFLCFTWGCQDASINIIMNTILGFEFKNKTVPFGAYRSLRNPIRAFIAFL